MSLPSRSITFNHSHSTRVDTIDSFQDKEYDVIIVFTVRCNVDKDMGFTSDPRRVNVALTRAKKSCFILGNILTISRSGRPRVSVFRDAMVRHVYAHVSSSGHHPKQRKVSNSSSQSKKNHFASVHEYHTPPSPPEGQPQEHPAGWSPL